LPLSDLKDIHLLLCKILYLIFNRGTGRIDLMGEDIHKNMNGRMGETVNRRVCQLIRSAIDRQKIIKDEVLFSL
jgi:hypothetical protein